MHEYEARGLGGVSLTLFDTDGAQGLKSGGAPDAPFDREEIRRRVLWWDTGEHVFPMGRSADGVEGLGEVLGGLPADKRKAALEALGGQSKLDAAFRVLRVKTRHGPLSLAAEFWSADILDEKSRASLKRQAVKKRYETALHLYEQLDELGVPRSALRQLADFLEQTGAHVGSGAKSAGRPELARNRVYRELRRHGLSPTMIARLVLCCGSTPWTPQAITRGALSSTTDAIKKATTKRPLAIGSPDRRGKSAASPARPPSSR